MEDPKQNQNEEEYEEMSPRLSAYIREIEEGREPLYVSNSMEEMWEQALGKNWRDAFENPDVVSNEKF